MPFEGHSQSCISLPFLITCTIGFCIFSGGLVRNLGAAGAAECGDSFTTYIEMR